MQVTGYFCASLKAGLDELSKKSSRNLLSFQLNFFIRSRIYPECGHGQQHSRYANSFPAGLIPDHEPDSRAQRSSHKTNGHIYCVKAVARSRYQGIDPALIGDM